MKLFFTIAALLIVGLGAWGWVQLNRIPAPAVLPAGITVPGGRQITKSSWAWRTQLAGNQFAVTRQGETEPAFSNPLHANHQVGTYRCICCRNPLFSSRTKFDSGTGWPSFFAPIAANAVYDRPNGRRTETRCPVCDAHLGHVFRDGPDPTGLRYCINGAALTFAPD